MTGPTSDEWADVPSEVREMARSARIQFERDRERYREFAESVAKVLRECLRVADVQFLSVTPRVKDAGSFERKAAALSPDDPSTPKYRDPLNEITDKAAARVITYFLSTARDVCRTIERNFVVTERLDKSGEAPEHVGYQSIHFLVSYPQERTSLSDYSRYNGLVAEIQVRTILQHAWAEIEHDIHYKAEGAATSKIARRFAALAGLIEIADREFQAIRNDHIQIKKRAQADIAAGRLADVEITADSVRAFLDQKLGPDLHISPYSYRWMARKLRRLGFVNLQEVSDCIHERDSGQIGQVLYGYRQNQMMLFQDLLLASMGEYFVRAHPQANERDVEFVNECYDKLHKLSDADIEIGSYTPDGYREGYYDWEESS